MVTIVKNNIPTGPIKSSIKVGAKVRRPGTKITPTIIIIHSTANPTSTAANERNWLVNMSNDRSASWNYAVDETGAVEAIPAGELSYNTLDARANHASISIEICESGDRVKTLRNAVDLVCSLMGQWNIPIDNVKRHGDFQNKNCPGILPVGPGWNGFIDSIRNFQNDGLNNAINRINVALHAKELQPFDSKYWIENASFGKTCNGEWVKSLILRFAKLI
jgi:N-acetylmuramoyl-L-alanine amidase